MWVIEPDIIVRYFKFIVCDSEREGVCLNEHSDFQCFSIFITLKSLRPAGALRKFFLGHFDIVCPKLAIFEVYPNPRFTNTKKMHLLLTGHYEPIQ